MKVVIVGAGPGGLYCGLLLKKADPSHEITIIERNPPDATYGWGVVFSERTLGALQDADAKTARAITGRFVLWEAIDVRYREEVMRCEGQVFAGIARTTLLRILQRRCEELGVEMRFRTEVADLEALAGADVIIAADGVNSMIRRAHAPAFKPRAIEGRARYIWYGTQSWLDAFTFIFRENEHGLFQVHAYPFDGATSTFIVECAEPVWRRAGLDRADEAESIAFCERLFAPELGGRLLLSNNSKWISFVTLKNTRWHHRNMVLLGDAAHTAHFSIGSGTKLAMEDAIALAQALEHHRHVEDAFNEYEQVRRPAVEALQQAASESQAYFEDLARYTHLAPLQFAFHLLTRSGRITYDTLRVRDSRFVDTVNRWFYVTTSSDRKAPGIAFAPQPMLTPLRLRGLDLANRVVLADRSDHLAHNGHPAPALRHHMVSLGMVGGGLVLTAPVAVSANARITPECPGLYDDAHRAEWAAIVDAVRAHSHGRIGMILNHAGPRGATRPRREGVDRPLREGGWPLLSASPQPYAAGASVPHEMSRADMHQVRAEFVHAAVMAREIGVDLLLIHAAHGYLLASFLSPLTNVRTDEYGGSLARRLRFPLEVIEAVREVWPKDRPLAAAFVADDCAPGGLGLQDGVAVAKALQARGVDIVQALTGHSVADAHPVYGRGFLNSVCDRIRNDAGVRTIASGFLVSADEVNTVLAAGRADLCVMEPLDLPQEPPADLLSRQESKTVESGATVLSVPESSAVGSGAVDPDATEEDEAPAERALLEHP